MMKKAVARMSHRSRECAAAGDIRGDPAYRQSGAHSRGRLAHAGCKAALSDARSSFILVLPADRESSPTFPVRSVTHLSGLDTPTSPRKPERLAILLSA